MFCSHIVQGKTEWMNLANVRAFGRPYFNVVGVSGEPDHERSTFIHTSSAVTYDNRLSPESAEIYPVDESHWIHTTYPGERPPAYLYSSDIRILIPAH